MQYSKFLGKVVFFIAIWMITLCLNADCAVLPKSGLTPEHIVRFRDDVQKRLTNLPKDEYELISERNWVMGEIGSVRAEISKFSTSPPKILENFDQYQKDIEGWVNNLKNLDCEDLASVKVQFENINYEWSSIDYELLQASRFIFRTQRGFQPYNKLRLLFSPILKYVGEKSDDLDTAACKTIVNRYKQPWVLKAINDFFDPVENKQKEIEKSRKEIRDSLSDLNSSLLQYNAALNKELDKQRTKSSLGSNLLWMILIIGGLSVLAILVVRIFPETVMKEWVESGQVIQFVTVMIILSSIMALGLSGLLSENTLGTLLGGIGGYVLSQGVGRTATRRALKEVAEQKKTDQNN